MGAPVDDEAGWLVVGLGNPGPQYELTRHNLGHRVLDALAADASARFRRHRVQAVVAETRLGVPGRPGPRVVLAKPASYMNLSGAPVAGLVRYYGVDIERLVVVHDELDVDFGRVKLKRGGGDAGNNGLRSVTKSLGTPDYLRVRCGIGRPPGRQDPADYVLRPFPAAARTEVELLIGDAAEAVELLLAEGLEAAQTRFHARG